MAAGHTVCDVPCALRRAGWAAQPARFALHHQAEHAVGSIAGTEVAIGGTERAHGTAGVEGLRRFWGSAARGCRGGW